MFTYSFNNGNEAFFIPVNVLSNATYQWSFGDGTSGFNAVEQHTYNVATSGWYAVCLTTINANNCTDYYCDSVYVTVPTSGPSCDAQFYSYSDSTIANMVYFYNYGNNAATANYFWNFGDGATGSGMYPTHTYATSGWYAVCLTVSDNSGSGCTQTYCDSVYADGGVVSPSCNASFILFQDSTGSGVYYAWNTSVGSGLSYYWDFGDGNTSTLAYPTHTYSAVGSYTICLTVYNNNGCSSTYCDNIVIVVKAAGTTLNVLQPGATVGVEEIALINEAKLYPNPNNGQFNMSINVSQSMDAVLNITNLMGQTVEVITLQLNQGGNVINFDQSHLTSGIYLVNLIDEQTGRNSTLKLIKE
jgi:PKD repeat protein